METVMGVFHNQNRLQFINFIVQLDETLPNYLINPSVPDKSICVGARCRQIGEFRPLRRDFTRLKDRRMSWIVSKGRTAVFLSYIAAGTSVKYYVLSQFKKVCAMIFSDFTTFRL